MQSQEHKKGEAFEIPDPVMYGLIQFEDCGTHVEYTDCWEISILRFLHLLFGKECKISQQKLFAYMQPNNPHCQSLIKYFSLHSTYELKENFYQTPQGLILRAEWCQFLNRSGVFHLKKEEKYEVAATFPNIIAFFRNYFPSLQSHYNNLPSLTIQNILSKQYFLSYQSILNEIYAELGKEFDLHAQMDVFCGHNNGYIYFSANQKLYLQGKHVLDWIISQAYDADDEEIGNRQGGHSDYRYANQQQ